MKKWFSYVLVLIVAMALLSGCGTQTSVKVTTPRIPQAISEDEPIIIHDNPTVLLDEPTLLWKEATHSSITADAATYWGLATARKNNMSYAAKMPDTYQSGLDNAFNQQWSHAFLYSSLGIWVWGDADDDYYDNLEQDGGELESPEGYNGKSAKYYYQAGNQKQGDWYVGYATHYIEDASLIMHASDPSVDMLTQHFNFEAWVANNWTSGHNFYNTIVNDTYYYVITDLKASIRNAANGASYWTSTLGKTVWDNYKASGYPTAVGSGNSTLVNNTKTMLIRAARYARGTIKYSLDKYSQWTYSGYVYP